MFTLTNKVTIRALIILILVLTLIPTLITSALPNQDRHYLKLIIGPNNEGILCPVYSPLYTISYGTYECIRLLGYSRNMELGTCKLFIIDVDPHTLELNPINFRGLEINLGKMCTISNIIPLGIYYDPSMHRAYISGYIIYYRGSERTYDAFFMRLGPGEPVFITLMDIRLDLPNTLGHIETASGYFFRNGTFYVLTVGSGITTEENVIIGHIMLMKASPKGSPLCKVLYPVPKVGKYIATYIAKTIFTKEHAYIIGVISTKSKGSILEKIFITKVKLSDLSIEWFKVYSVPKYEEEEIIDDTVNAFMDSKGYIYVTGMYMWQKLTAPYSNFILKVKSSTGELVWYKIINCKLLSATTALNNYTYFIARKRENLIIGAIIGDDLVPLKVIKGFTPTTAYIYIPLNPTVDYMYIYGSYKGDAFIMLLTFSAEGIFEWETPRRERIEVINVYGKEKISSETLTADTYEYDVNVVQVSEKDLNKIKMESYQCMYPNITDYIGEFKTYTAYNTIKPVPLSKMPLPSKIGEVTYTTPTSTTPTIPLTRIPMLGVEVTVLSNVSRTVKTETITNKTMSVELEAITTIKKVIVYIAEKPKPGYLVNHKVKILESNATGVHLKIVMSISKRIAPTVDYLIMPPKVEVIEREPVIALDIGEPTKGKEASLDVIVLTNVTETEFLKGIEIKHVLVPAPVAAAGPGIITPIIVAIIIVALGFIGFKVLKKKPMKR